MGVTTDTIDKLYQNYRFVDSMIIMAISLLITFWLGIYLDNVLPSAYGVRRPWYFCLTKSYWFAAKQRSNSAVANTSSYNKVKVRDRDNESKDECGFETKYMKKENFEAPSNDLRIQEKSDKILKIQDLKKTFENGF